MHQVYITSLLPFTSGVYGTFVITEQILKADREASTTSIITDHAELYSRIVRYIGVICSCCFIRSEFNYVVGDLRDITTVFFMQHMLEACEFLHKYDDVSVFMQHTTSLDFRTYIILTCL